MQKWRITLNIFSEHACDKNKPFVLNMHSEYISYKNELCALNIHPFWDYNLQNIFLFLLNMLTESISWKNERFGPKNSECKSCKNKLFILNNLSESASFSKFILWIHKNENVINFPKYRLWVNKLKTKMTFYPKYTFCVHIQKKMNPSSLTYSQNT